MQARDPIPAFRKFALEEGLMSDADVKDIEKQIVAEVEEAVKFADESPKPVSTTYLTPMAGLLSGSAEGQEPGEGIEKGGGWVGRVV